VVPSTHLRTIAMSRLTTVFGLAPRVFLAGKGTELYRGIGVIVMFGLPGTAIVSLTFLPAFLLRDGPDLAVPVRYHNQ